MNSTAEEKLNNFRIQIDEIDNRLLELIIKRLELGRQIGEIKSELGVLLRDELREAEILARLTHMSKDKIYRTDIERIFSEIIEVTRRSQHQGRTEDEE